MHDKDDGQPTRRPGPTNSEFLLELAQAADNGSWLWVTHFIGTPSPHANWGGEAYRPQGITEVDTWDRYNTYFSTAAVKADEDGELARKKANFSRLLCVVVDDADEDGLMAAPSWVLQTSPGKCQVGFFVEGDDCANLQLVTALVTRLVKKGLIGGDISGNNAVRYVRLPVGTNLKPRPTGPFEHHMSRWAPQVRYSLEDAAGAVGIDLDEIKAELLASPVASAGIGTGEQSDKLRTLTSNILRGVGLHDSINELAASMVASGTEGGAVVNMLRGLMEASGAARDDRWSDRYADIPRSVSTAEAKFGQLKKARLTEPLVIAIGTPSPVVPAVVPDAETKPAETILAQLSDFRGALSPIKWLVKGYLEEDALTMMYGPPSAGKSFVAIDLVCSIANGVRWHGVEVKQGPVIYVAGEGKNGIVRRMAAWGLMHAEELAKAGIDPWLAPIHLSKKSVQILNLDAVGALQAEIDDVARKWGSYPRAVVIDTLARNYGDGDENSTEDANRFIEHIDSYIRHRYQCNVIVVHHSGHDASRARGSSAFKAAVDQEVSVKGGALVTVEMTKMKDAELPIARQFKIEGAHLGDAPDGEPIMGAALRMAGNPLELTVAKSMPPEPQPIPAWKVLQIVHVEWLPLTRLAETLHCSKNMADQAVRECKNLGYLEPKGRGFVLSELARVEMGKCGLMLPGMTGASTAPGVGDE